MILYFFHSHALPCWYLSWILRLCQYIDWTGLRQKILHLGYFASHFALALGKVLNEGKQTWMKMHSWNHSQYTQLFSIKHFWTHAKNQKGTCKKTNEPSDITAHLVHLRVQEILYMVLEWNCYTMQKKQDTCAWSSAILPSFSRMISIRSLSATLEQIDYQYNVMSFSKLCKSMYRTQSVGASVSSAGDFTGWAIVSAS